MQMPSSVVGYGKPRNSQSPSIQMRPDSFRFNRGPRFLARAADCLVTTFDASGFAYHARAESPGRPNTFSP